MLAHVCVSCCSWEQKSLIIFMNTCTHTYTLYSSVYTIDSITRPIVLMYPVYYCASKLWIMYLPCLFLIFSFSLCSFLHTHTRTHLQIRAHTLSHYLILYIVNLIGLDSNIVIFGSRFWQSKKKRRQQQQRRRRRDRRRSEKINKKQQQQQHKQTNIWTYYTQIMTNWKFE